MNNRIQVAMDFGTSNSALWYVPLDLIRTDGDTQPRVTLDQILIEEYAWSYGNRQPEMPPIDVFLDGETLWLADGFHRHAAAGKAGAKRISCHVRKGSLNDARWYSYKANQEHGLRRSSADKAKAVKGALQHPNGATLSDSQIAVHVGVSDKTIAKYRADLESTSEIPKSNSRTGRDGRTTDTSRIGKGQEARQKLQRWIIGMDVVPDPIVAAMQNL